MEVIRRKEINFKNKKNETGNEYGEYKAGHDLNRKENVWIRTNKKRICKICNRKRLTKWRHDVGISKQYKEEIYAVSNM